MLEKEQVVVSGNYLLTAFNKPIEVYFEEVPEDNLNLCIFSLIYPEVSAKEVVVFDITEYGLTWFCDYSSINE